MSVYRVRIARVETREAELVVQAADVNGAISMALGLAPSIDFHGAGKTFTAEYEATDWDLAEKPFNG